MTPTKLPPIHILATCRNPELFRATTLVFDTLRVGFPNSEITVYENCLCHNHASALLQKMVESKLGESKCLTIEPTIHHKWIEQLLVTETEPFIILDTDMVFWKDCEWFDYADYPMAGRLIPQFFDPFTNCISKPRMHGSFLYLNPARIKQEIEAWRSNFPDTPFNPPANLIYPVMVPLPPPREIEPFSKPKRGVFYDTCALLYQAIGQDRERFTQVQLDCYDHMNCGTISDIVAPHLTDIRMREAHFAVFENPAILRGVWRQQEAWYKKHAV